MEILGNLRTEQILDKISLLLYQHGPDKTYSEEKISILISMVIVVVVGSIIALSALSATITPQQEQYTFVKALGSQGNGDRQFEPPTDVERTRVLQKVPRWPFTSYT